MKTIRTIALLSTFALAVGCQTKENTEGFKVYGGKSEVQSVLTLSDVVARADSLKDKKVCIKGEISAVCKTRGCWMEVTDGSHKARVRFTKSEACSDGYYVPRNSDGHKVYLNGTVEVVEVPEETARHYAEDKGMSTEEIEKIKGPQKEITIFAEAVSISDGDKLDEPFQSKGTN